MYHKNSYSLVELSISLTIIALLITSGATIFAKKSEIDKIKITKERMDTIEKAIANYVDLYGFIPCPATGKSIETDVYFGDSISPPRALYNNTSHLCDLTYTVSGNTVGTTHNVGMIPVNNLGLDYKYAYDGWGRKFSYQIAKGMGNLADFSDINYKGDIDIIDHNGINITNRYMSAPNNYGAAYVIVSFGKDGIGAWNKNDRTAPSTTSSSNIEYNNSLYLSQASNIYIKDMSAANFNNLVTFKTKQMLTSAKRGISPIKIPQYMCDDANAIANSGFPGGTSFSSSANDFTVSSASNTSLKAQIYLSAMKAQKLCNNPPLATYNLNTNSASSCNFNPNQISNLILWLDANDPNADGTNPSIASNISTWYDKSGLSNDVRAYLASPASRSFGNTGLGAVVSNYIGFPFNKYVLNFSTNGSVSQNIYSKQNVANIPSGNTVALTVFIVESQVSYLINSTNTMLSFNSYNGGCFFGIADICGASQLNNCNLELLAGNCGGSNCFSSPSSSVAYTTLGDIPDINNIKMKIITGTTDGAQTINLQTLDKYNIYNSINSSSTSAFSNSCSSNNGTSSGWNLYIGASANNSNNLFNYYKGYIGEILVYASALKPSEIKSIQGYLSRKWLSGECP